MSTSESRLECAFACLAGHRLPIAVVVAIVVVAAVVVLQRKPLQLLPEIHYPQIRVIGDYPGRTAAVIEESVNQPLEEAFAGLEGLLKMESRTGDGRSYIELFFQPGHDLDRGLQDALQGVARARASIPKICRGLQGLLGQGVARARASIPPEFSDPRVFSVGTTESPVMQIAFSSTQMSAHDLRNRLRSEVLPRLRNIRGVEAAFIAREDNRELVVELDREAMEIAGPVILLHAFGQSLNLLTMAGLLLSVGLGLDYAIIFFDRLERLAKSGNPDLAISIAGRTGAGGTSHVGGASGSPAESGKVVESLPARAAASVAGPLVGAVITTLGAILPFLFVDGLIALLFRPLILTVATASVLTFVFAMVILPATRAQTPVAP